jgi:glucokinase
MLPSLAILPRLPIFQFFRFFRFFQFFQFFSFMIWSAGIDVGGTNLKVVAVSPEGAVLQRTSVASRDVAGRTAAWSEQAREMVADFEDGLASKPASIGVCAPGLAALDGRSISHMPGRLAGLTAIDWTVALGQTTVVPVLNDAHAAIIAEAWIGAAKGRKHVVMLTLGTGVGGAVIADGRLLRGAIGRAGHIGHMSLDPEGPTSVTGMPGAIEVMFGDCTVAERSGGKFSTTAALVSAFRAGDVDAKRVWLRSTRALATALASCINLFDPEVVVLGGAIAQAGDALLVPLGIEMDRIEWRPGGHRVAIVPAALGEWAGAIGAARNSLSP